MKKLTVFTLATTLATVGAGAVWAEGHMQGDGDHKSRHARHMARMMEHVDTDGDGRISHDEFLISHEERFAKMDGNGDGYIDADERAKKRDEMRERFQEHREKRRESMEQE